MIRQTITLVFIFAAMFASCSNSNSTKHAAHSDSSHTAGKYQCPMDCEKGKTYDAAGKCPVCKMDLRAK